MTERATAEPGEGRFACAGLERHPCYSRSAHMRYGRIHLPVAPRCNLDCGYCERRTGGLTYHVYRPSVASRTLTPPEAVAQVARNLHAHRLTVAGIAGPGEPLCNEETFETLRLVGSCFPELMLCLATNGVLLAERAEELHTLGVTALTVTLNTVEPALGARIYSQVDLGGDVCTGSEAAAAVLARQLAGIRSAAAVGITVKVNSVLIPGVNDDFHLEQVARTARRLGALVQNITPLIPLGRFREIDPPTCAELHETRLRCERHLPQFRHCQQCRADAVGIPGARSWSAASVQCAV